MIYIYIYIYIYIIIIIIIIYDNAILIIIQRGGDMVRYLTKCITEEN